MKISIIIRAFNEEAHIGKLFDGIRAQKAAFKPEVVLVDSGSTDATIEVASRFGAKVVSILPGEFSFGRSLNRGIEAAGGEFCVMVSAHCYPENGVWLERLLKPFEDKAVALVYGRQRGVTSTRYSERQIFARWFPSDGGGRQDNPFCNNANAAIRRSLWEERRYDEDLTGLEDLDWAKHAASRGFAVYYEPEASVFHVHEETAIRIFRRYEREAMALRKIFPEERFSLGDFIRLFFLNTASDYSHAIGDGVFLRNVIDIPVARLMQFWGTYCGHNYARPASSGLKKKFYYPRGY